MSPFDNDPDEILISDLTPTMKARSLVAPIHGQMEALLTEHEEGGDTGEAILKIREIQKQVAMIQNEANHLYERIDKALGALDVTLKEEREAS